MGTQGRGRLEPNVDTGVMRLLSRESALRLYARPPPPVSGAARRRDKECSWIAHHDEIPLDARSAPGVAIVSR